MNNQNKQPDIQTAANFDSVESLGQNPPLEHGPTSPIPPPTPEPIPMPTPPATPEPPEPLPLPPKDVPPLPPLPPEGY